VVDYDGQHVRENRPWAASKDKNIRRGSARIPWRSRTGESVPLPGNPGKVVEITQNGADDHINSLSQNIWGNPVTHPPAGRSRVLDLRASRTKLARWAEVVLGFWRLVDLVMRGSIDEAGNDCAGLTRSCRAGKSGGQRE